MPAVFLVYGALKRISWARTPHYLPGSGTHGGGSADPSNLYTHRRKSAHEKPYFAIFLKAFERLHSLGGHDPFSSSECVL